MSARGAALPAAMLSVLAFVIVIAGTYALLRVQVRETIYQVRLAQAQAIAEAGLEDALGQISSKPSWKTGYPSGRNFAGGYYIVTCSTDVVNRWVTSTGYSAPVAIMGRAVRTVKAQSISDGNYNFADSTFTVNWAMTSFDSAIKNPTCKISGMGTKTTTVKGCFAGPALWANTTVAAPTGAVRVNGDVTYATPSSTAPAQSTIAGVIYMETSKTTVDVEDGTPYIAANDNLTRISVTKGTATNPYDPATMILSVTSATVLSNGAVILSSGTFYFKGIDISSRTLYFNLTDGEIANVYLKGNLIMTSSGTIDSNQSKYACDQHIYGQGGGTITLSGYINVHNGIGNNVDNITRLDIFAPQDTVILNQRMLGRLIGKTVTINNPYGAGNAYPIFFFDTQCGYAQASGTRWIQGTWKESYLKP